MATLKVPSPYSTIQAAVDAAELGDTIIVNNPLSGDSYNEQVIINKNNIRIRANGDFFLDGNTPISYENAFLVHADNVTIEGFLIAHYDDGIVIEGSNNNITKCTFRYNYPRAILVHIHDSNFIYKNLISDCNIGIEAEGCSNHRITNNIIALDGITDSIGILLKESNGNTVNRNTIRSEDGIGIEVLHSYSNTISRNYFEDTSPGVVQRDSSANDITKNTIKKQLG